MKSPSPSQINEFCLLLSHYGLYQPEELYKVVCPFHGDVNASMQINIPACFFFCYAECGAKGSTVELYKCFEALENRFPTDLEAMFGIKKLIGKKNKSYHNKNKSEINHVSHACPTHTDTHAHTQADAHAYKRDAINSRLYISNTNLSKYNINPTSYLLLNKKVTYIEGINQARDFYFNLPKTNWYKPGLEEGTIAKRYMRQRGYSAKLLTASGAKVTFNQYYPIVFPLFENSIFRGYVMRTFDKEIEQKRKYMYNRGFKRERTLPGSFKAETVLIVEGYLDKLKANQLGINNVVAILGWKISATHLDKLKKAGVKQLICATDNDTAGRKGYAYLKRICKQYDFLLNKLYYPKGIKDMGDIKQNTAEATLVLSQLFKLGVYKPQ